MPIRTSTRDRKWARNVAINQINQERERQIKKWGEQCHDISTWCAILMEEVGELSEAALHCKFGGPKANGLKKEAIQAAAVAMQIVEMLELNLINDVDWDRMKEGAKEGK